MGDPARVCTWKIKRLKDMQQSIIIEGATSGEVQNKVNEFLGIEHAKEAPHALTRRCKRVVSSHYSVFTVITNTGLGQQAASRYSVFLVWEWA